MINIYEYLLGKNKKFNMIHATNDNIRLIVKNELDKQGPNADLNYVDVSEVTDMSFLFCGRMLNSNCLGLSYDDINPDVTYWDVSKVENMKCMFYYLKNFNRNISEWNVNKVKDMSYMFYKCKKFYQNLYDWETENLESYLNMFSDRMLKKKKYWPKAFPWE